MGKGHTIGRHFKPLDIACKNASGLFIRDVLIAGSLTMAQAVRIEPPLIVAHEQMDIALVWARS